MPTDNFWSRRQFIQAATAAAAATQMSAPALAGPALSSDGALDWPVITSQHRPWTRNWWMGSAVDEKNLAEELWRYAAAGLGGIDVVPIYGAKGWESRYIPFLTRRWMAMFKFNIQTAHRIGMGSDMSNSTGWNMGGPTITGPYASLYARPVAIRAPASATARWREPWLRQPVLYARAFSGSGEQVEVPLHHIHRDGTISWPRPAGRWTLVVLIAHPGSHVKRAGPGGYGMMLNTIYPPAMTHYLQSFSRAFAESDAPRPRAMFHDSYEYNSGVPGGYGEWSPDFFDQFVRLRGYRLEEHLLALAGIGDAGTIGRVKSDYRQCVSELISESVFSIWVQWAHKLGMLARNQAHGAPANLLDFYAIADIPETEDSILDPRQWLCDPLFAKFASSAAHVAGRPLASSETFTWVGEHFTIPLAKLKHVVDHCFVGGINHIFYQGTCYSPDDAAWPGWLWYASVDYNPRMGIWRDSRAFNDYIARCQSLLQSGAPDNDVLLYWPIFDQWHDPKGLGQYQTTGAVPEWFYGHSIGQTAKSLWKLGYTFDYISDHLLESASVKRGLIQTPGSSYRAIVVPPVKHMPPETLKQILKLAHRGATVIFEGGLPTEPPGLFDLSRRRERMRKLAAEVSAAEPSEGANAARVQVGAGYVYLGRASRALESAGIARETLTDHKGLMFVRRRDGDGHVYFVAWPGDQALDVKITLAVRARGIVFMDPLSDRTGIAPAEFDAVGRATVRIRLEAHGSLIIRALPRAVERGAEWKYIEPGRLLRRLAGPWQVDFIQGGPTLPKAYEAPTAGSWTDNGDPATEHFTGTGRYTIYFDRPEHPGPWLLDLGDVRESARVQLNGTQIATLIQAPWRVVIDSLRPAHNKLEIEVTNLSANRIRYMDRHHIPWRIFHDINFVSITYRPFDAAHWPVRPSGLMGPVTLSTLL